MSLFSIAPRITPDEFGAFLALMAGDPDFPRSYDGWHDQGLKDDGQNIAQGRLIHEVVVHAQEFADHCKALGQQPTLATLHAFAAKKHHKWR